MRTIRICRLIRARKEAARQQLLKRVSDLDIVSQKFLQWIFSIVVAEHVENSAFLLEDELQVVCDGLKACDFEKFELLLKFLVLFFQQVHV